MAVTRTYGRLELGTSAGGPTAWRLSTDEPHIAIRLKQIFARIPKQMPSPWILQRDDMLDADLHWFMQRYPLEMDAKARKAIAEGRARFERDQAEAERILLPSYKPGEIPGLKPGQVVRGYQAQAIDLLRLRKRLLIGDEGGLGKTYTATAFLAGTPAALPAAIVMDAHLQTQWSEVIEKYSHLTLHRIKGTKPYGVPKADCYLFRITCLAGWVDIFNMGLFRTVIFDEPQNLRTGIGTAKGQAAAVLASKAIYRAGLSATPIYNYGNEMWNIAQFIDEEALGDSYEFRREWCDDFGKVKDPKALGTYLRERHFLLRRLKSDVGQELPKVSRIVQAVDHDAAAIANVEQLARSLALAATKGSFVERGSAARELDLRVRQATGIAKAPYVAKFVRIIAEAGEKVVLWGWHRAVYQIWLKELQDLKPAMYTGSESASQKNAAKAAFMGDETNILIMSLRSGAGIDGLQHVCSVGVFGELDWSPGIHQQCIWRLDRDGQTQPVQAFFLVSDDGSDPPMQEVLGLKAYEASSIVDPHLGQQAVENDTSRMAKLIQRYLDGRQARGVA
ncbi:MAG: DEAD/DEAH box helicase [Ferrovibrio sp.]|nr:DEAD/DEAH box helicase [Ferrovibrio sp.]